MKNIKSLFIISLITLLFSVSALILDIKNPDCVDAQQCVPIIEECRFCMYGSEECTGSWSSTCTAWVRAGMSSASSAYLQMQDDKDEFDNDCYKLHFECR